MTTQTMPDWLQDQLVADGVMTVDFITRKTKPRRCKACRATCLAAIDDLGLEAWTDPAPLTPEGEFLAAMAGRATFLQLGPDLIHRDAGQITHRPASAWTVLAEHRCGSPPLPSKPPRAAKRKTTNPPF